MSVRKAIVVTYHKPRTKKEKCVPLFAHEASSICCLLPTKHSIWSYRCSRLSTSPNHQRCCGDVYGSCFCPRGRRPLDTNYVNPNA
jgi:hypothetical protein